MDALEQARAEIDTVDAQLAALFERRMLLFYRWPNISGRTACPSTMPPGRLPCWKRPQPHPAACAAPLL